ncbi:MAG: STAS domain-containing protein [Acidimicrobiia bacterium]|nr:STAS domain-containing protein [Acidimicrobiia bacterium]
MRSTNVAQPDGARLVTVSGEVDIATASELRHAVHDACGYLPLYIQLDLQAVTFIDASGLRGLWDAALELRGSGVPFRVSPVSDVVRRVLEVSESATWLSWTPASSQTPTSVARPSMPSPRHIRHRPRSRGPATSESAIVQPPAPTCSHGQSDQSPSGEARDERGRPPEAARDRDQLTG